LTKASINIREVARVAKVGVATVSRVINSSDLISPRTREHVQKVIRQLGFRPHALARRILRHSQMICFVLANRPFLHPFHAGILQGAETCARELKQNVVFLEIECHAATPPAEVMLPPILEEKGWAEGVILTGVVFPNLISRLAGLHLPLVVFGNNVVDSAVSNGVTQVRYDGIQAEFDATQYLIERGHRSIAYIGHSRFPWFREQHRGYLKAMRAHRLQPLSVARKGPENYVEYGSQATASLMEAPHAPTAFLAGNDEIAFGVCRTVRSLYRQVPRDVSVIGFDDREIAAVMDPPLTTVRVPSQEIGRCCMRLLFDRLYNNLFVNTHLVATELVERESVASPRAPRN
jgi:DNA-binding LacI/PurR family transcriptional regulator